MEAGVASFFTCAGQASFSLRPPPSISVSSCLFSGYMQALEA